MLWTIERNDADLDVLPLKKKKNLSLLLSKPQSQFGCQISNHFSKLAKKKNGLNVLESVHQLQT